MSNTATTAQIARFRSDASRWRAVRQRDARASGAFVYAVRTTNVFCRPNCGSRLPKRQNVTFFQTAPEAERAGFAPCRKCRPLAKDTLPDAIRTACRMIEQSDRRLLLRTLADAVGMSPGHFQKTFKQFIGVSPLAYASARRANRLRATLGKEQTVTATALAAGFGSESRVYQSAKRELGMTPRRFREGGADQHIRLAVVKTSLGLMAVGATQCGVCLIQFGDDAATLERSARATFPKAELDGADPQFSDWVGQVVKCVDAPSGIPPIPLDIRGTAFQRKVWQALREIPPGATASYMQIATKIGHPSAVRAVAGACGANDLAVLIPCHRVVRSDGGLSGFRWGVDRKRKLLEREGARAKADQSRG